MLHSVASKYLRSKTYRTHISMFVTFLFQIDSITFYILFWREFNVSRGPIFLPFSKQKEEKKTEICNFEETNFV